MKLLSLNAVLVWFAFMPSVFAQNCIQKRIVVLGNNIGSKDQANLVASLYARVASRPCVALIDVDDYLEAGASPAHAKIEEGEEFLAMGQKRFLDGQISSAFPILAKAVTALLDGYSYLVYPTSLVDALMLYGACSSMLGKDQEARKAFSMALQLKQTVDVKEYSVSSEAMIMFEEVKKTKGQGKGMLEVFSNPELADVFVDGQRKGVTPLIGLEIEDGYHFIVVKKQGYMRASSVVSIRSSETTKVELSLSPARRKPLLDVVLKKVSSGGPIPQISEDLKALFLADAALIVDFKDRDDRGSVLLIDLDMRVLVGKSENGQIFDLDGYMDRIVSARDLHHPTPQKTVSKQVRFYERWWFWTAVGAVCASGALTLALLLPRESVPAKAPQGGKGVVLIRF